MEKRSAASDAASDADAGASERHVDAIISSRIGVRASSARWQGAVCARGKDIVRLCPAPHRMQHRGLVAGVERPPRANHSTISPPGKALWSQWVTQTFSPMDRGYQARKTPGLEKVRVVGCETRAEETPVPSLGGVQGIGGNVR